MMLERDAAEKLRATTMLSYSIWIEAECWVPGEWNERDGNTDVVVTFEDGTRWGATLLAYANVLSLSAKNQRTGERLAGKYLWVSDMLLVDSISRERIEELVAHLLESGEFTTVFTRYSDATEDA